MYLHLANDNNNNNNNKINNSKTNNNKTSHNNNTYILNWSNFKPEFSGKPDEDAEVHLLHSNDWMNVHHFVSGVKVQRFFLTLLGEARLWYHSLKPINVDWPELQNLFRQRYSKVGNMREQLFHTWRSFNFDENTEIMDAYVTQIRQVATLLAMGSHKSSKYSRIYVPQNYIGYCFL